ncbi:MAG: hypothetical protein F4W90_01535 [Gammaproteobacteria bacterium]|nr:hypothetical protein [Gammaproteobacteria bacterium]
MSNAKTKAAEFQERAVTVPTPQNHYSFLVADNGLMLGLNDAGELADFAEASDQVIWQAAEADLTHVASQTSFSVSQQEGRCDLIVDGVSRSYVIAHGPEKLPSAYLAHLRAEGWVCLTSILPPEVVDSLQRVAGSDAYEHLTMNNDSPKICQDVAVGIAISEPISIWLIREYMSTRDLHLGHPPGFAVLRPYDGESPVQGWHADIPYIPSIGGNLVADRNGPIKAVQRNVCVSDFRKANGATAFKLGSHVLDSPPENWNPARHGGPTNARPYSGPEADVLEAPAGSIILYDARTWHRAGFNHSTRKRAAMLQSFQAADVIPKRDTRPTCAQLHASPVYQDLNRRQQADITELLMNQPDSLQPSS